MNSISKFYAASNSFDGFKSYFNVIFDREKFDKVYIIKGGPGTGKSALMKRILKEFEGKAKCNTILCSSDPNSVDGIIVEANGKRIGVIDGTAPHEEDTRFPGAVDELINLGEAWNTNELNLSKNDIVRLTRTKKSYYKKAYDLLKIAGEIYKQKSALVKEAYVGDDEKALSDIIKNIDNKIYGRNNDVLLISSFSKDGYSRIKDSAKDKIGIVGRYGSEYVFIENLSKKLADLNIEFTVIPSPFSSEIKEGIYFPSVDLLIISDNSCEQIINTSKFIDDTVINSNNYLLEFYETMQNEFLKKAKEALTCASEAHFKIEEIYVKAMDFDMHTKITSAIINEIKIYLR